MYLNLDSLIKKSASLLIYDLNLMDSMIKKFSFPRMQNRQFVFEPKMQYVLTAERSETASSGLPFPKVSPRQESNPHHEHRKLAFYPLNYEGLKLDFAHQHIGQLLFLSFFGEITYEHIPYEHGILVSQRDLNVRGEYFLAFQA